MSTCTKCGFAMDSARSLPTRCPRCGTSTQASSPLSSPPPPAKASEFDLPPPPAAAGGPANRTIFGMPGVSLDELDRLQARSDTDFSPPAPPAVDLDPNAGDLELDFGVPPDENDTAALSASDLEIDDEASLSASDLELVDELSGARRLPGEIDLPAPKDLDLPAPVARRNGTGAASNALDFDLPAPLDFDLPVPATPGELEPKGIELEPARQDLQPSTRNLALEPKHGSELKPKTDAASVDHLGLDLGSDPQHRVRRHPGEPELQDPRLTNSGTLAVRTPSPADVENQEKRGPSRAILIAAGGLAVVALAGAGVVYSGVLDQQTEDPTQHGPSKPQQQVKRRSEAVLAEFAADTPASYHRALGLTERDGDTVGRAEAATLLHFRYGPDPVHAGQGNALLEPHRERTEPFVRRVLGLSSLANGDLAGAESFLADNEPQTRLYRGWLRAAQARPSDALAEAEAVLTRNPNDLAALHLRHRARVAMDVPGALEDLARAAEAHREHPLLQVLLAQSLFERGLLAEARGVIDDVTTASNETSPGFQAQLSVLRGRILAATGDRSSALNQFDQALQLYAGDPGVKLERLRVLMDAQEFMQVSRELAVLLAEHPDSLEANLLKAELALATGNGDEALSVLEAVSKKHDKHPRVLFLIGEVHAMRMTVDDARAAYASVRAIDPLFVPAIVADAKLLAKLEKLDDAMALLEEGRKQVAEGPGGSARAAKLLQARAEILHAAGQVDAAMQALDEALSVDPNNNEALLLRGRWRLAADRNDAAKEDFEALFKRTGGYAGLAGPLGAMYLHENKIPEVERLLGRQADDPRAADDLLLLAARLRLAQDQPDQAKTFVDNVLGRNPGNWEAHLVRAQLLVSTGDYAGALVEIQQARPKKASAEVELWTGKVFEYNGRLDEALPYYTRALELDDNLLEARFLRGRLLTRAGAAKQAIADLQPVVERTDLYPGAWLALGQAQRDLGQLDDAIASLRKCTELDPQQGEAFYWIGRIHHDNNRHAQTVQALEKAIAVGKPEDWWIALAYRMIGGAYVQTGRKPEARTALENYLRISPLNSAGRPEVERMLRELQ